MCRWCDGELRCDYVCSFVLFFLMQDHAHYYFPVHTPRSSYGAAPVCCVLKAGDCFFCAWLYCFLVVVTLFYGDAVYSRCPFVCDVAFCAWLRLQLFFCVAKALFNHKRGGVLFVLMDRYCTAAEDVCAIACSVDAM